jgi:hypothetical protein
MRLPIIDTVVVRFVTAGPAEPVLDYENRAQKVGVASSVHSIWQVRYRIPLVVLTCPSRYDIT